MNQPFAMVAILYGAGIILGNFLEAPLFPTIIIGFVSALLALAFRAWRDVLIPIAIILFGWVNMSSRTMAISPFDLRSIWPAEGEIATIRAIIRESPSERVVVRQDAETSHTLAVLEVTAVRAEHGEWRPAYGRVMSRTSGILPPEFLNGQAVEVSGHAVEPARRLAAGMFDYKQHLSARGIHYEFRTESAHDWKTFGLQKTPPTAERFRSWAQRNLARGLPEEDEALRLQWAMLLGWKTALTSEVSEPFMRSGTMHIFAISGLHIALIAGICVALLRALALPQIACGLTVVPIIWFYTAATGWQASAIRATVMMTIIIGGWALKRPTVLVNSLATAGAVILIWQPEQLFQPGFQLSFFVVLSIALLSPKFDRLKERLFCGDTMLPDKLRPRWQRIGLRAAGLAWGAFAVSLAAFVGSIPLIAYYFHLFTPGSLLANLVIVPVSSLALMSGIASLITGDFAPLLTEWFNHSGWFWMRWMIWMSETAASLPAAWCYVSTPSPLSFCLYYGLLIVACSGRLRRPRVRPISSAVILTLAIVCAFDWHKQRTWHRLTVIPFKGSHSIFVEPAKGGDEWLINCGDQGAVEFSLKPFLQSRGVDRVPHLILSQGETRYVSGAPLLHENSPIGWVHAPPIAFRSPRYRDTLAELEKLSRLARDVTNGSTLSPWTVLHPNASDRFGSAKDSAAVALGKFDGVSVLILPPLGRPGQNAVFTSHPNLRADVIIVSTTDDRELSPTWLATMQPRMLIIVGEGPTLKRQASVVRTLKNICPTVFVRRESGAVTISAREEEWKIRTARSSPNELEPGHEMGALSALGE